VNLNGGSIVADPPAGPGPAASLSLTGLIQVGPEINTMTPAISSIAESPSGGGLNVGNTGTLTLNFTEAVTVAGGTPTLTLNNGGTATYTGGSGTSALTFSYTVGAAQSAVSLAATAVILNGASIADDAGNNANLSLTGIIQLGPEIGIPITITTGGTTYTVDPLIAGFVDPADAIGSSVEIIVKNSSNVVVQQIQNIAVNAQGGFSSRLDLPTDGQYTAVAILTTGSGLSAASDGASYILNSTPNEPSFGTISNGVFTPNNDAAEVARLYYSLLHRAPDPGGLQAFTTALENGASLPQITQSFLGSAEYETTSIGQSNASFVQFLYSTALGRSPDTPGFQGWDNALNIGTLSRADVVNGVLASSEFQSDFAGQSDATYINEVYEVALQRPADPQGLQGWEAALSNGMSRTTFDQLVAGSPEFQSSITELAAASFVGTLYEQALGRAPDPGGLQSWTSALVTSNLNNIGAAIGIPESPEAQQFLASRIENGWHLA
jgi:hypothetical protein